MGEVYLEIPYDVLFQILLRLRVRSLLPLTEVCKAWRSIISFDSDFIRAHFLLAEQNPECKHRIRIMFLPKDNCVCRPICHYSHVMVGNTRISLAFCDDTVINTRLEILASYKGMLLVGFGLKDHYLWNPTTGSHRKLGGNLYHCRQDFRMYGLGYYSCSFKVIRIVRMISHNYDKTTFRIYNSRTNSWKRIAEEFPYIVFSSQRGVVWNGSPHWVVARPERRGVVIIYFDLAAEEEKFKELDCPVFLLDDQEIQLAVSDGFLYLELRSEVWVMKELRRKVWVMKEYGGSWIELTSEERLELVGLNYQLFTDISYVESLISPHIGTE